MHANSLKTHECSHSVRFQTIGIYGEAVTEMKRSEIEVRHSSVMC